MSNQFTAPKSAYLMEFNMPWQYDVTVEGTDLDIEYTADRDIETGEHFFNIESVQIGGVDVGPLLYAIGEDNAKRMLDAALAAAIKDDAENALEAAAMVEA